MKKLAWMAILVAVLSFGLAEGGWAEEPKTGGILRYRITADPPNLDPAQAVDTDALRGVNLMFEQLVDYDSDANKVVPLLAESWESNADATVWTFHLRRGVHFHKTCGGEPTANGGREMTAADVKYSFERMIRTNCPRIYFIDMVKGYRDLVSADTTGAKEWTGIKVLDDHTVQFELEYPFAPFLTVLTYDSYVVVAPEDAEKWGKEFNFHPVGTGPFAFDKWTHDSILSLKKHDAYWMKDPAGHPLPYADGVELVILPDDTIAYEEFKKGNIDIFPDCPDEVYQEVKATLGPKGQFQQRPWLGTFYWCFNLEKEPFQNNLKLRQALNYAVDRAAVNDVVLNGRYFVATGVLPPGMPGYNADLKGYGYDPEKAKALLKEAGFENGFEVTLQIASNKRQKAIAEAIQGQLANLGITLKIQEVDKGAHLDTVHRGETVLSRNSWVVDYVDPDNFLHVLFHSSNHGGKGNYSRYSNPEVDQLLDEARRETDWTKRIALYQKAEQQIVDAAPWLFLYYFTTDIMFNADIHGVNIPAMGEYKTKLTAVWKDPQ